ncbi:hypothetical protein PILCRDRAFT_80603 [Piloderma croceum F 1598]|uniref:CHAT domain-containing protein n=1 Tax=Piloderma croceum (strain F 1598) TaxID=765440 RepID=A0A0C3B953_PILCF|nr:hypothetical protein PILCRDRAFT_80603 [Piloderma croceum F 1598]
MYHLSCTLAQIGFWTNARVQLGFPTLTTSSSLSNLASALRLRFEHSGQCDDLDRAISLYRDLLELLPATRPDRSSDLNNLAAALNIRFNQLGLREDLDEAISFHRDALELRPVPHPDRSDSLVNLANALDAQFEQTGRRENLDEAISLSRAALELLPEPHYRRPLTLNKLATVLDGRFGQSGRPEDLAESISLCREALKLFSPTDPVQPRCLNNLAGALRKQFVLLGQHEDVDEAISLHRDALKLFPATHPLRPFSLDNLGSTLSTRYDLSGQRQDLDEAISLHRDALELEPSPGPDRYRCLNNLAVALSTLFSQSGQCENLDAAIDAYYESLSLLANRHPSICLISANLGRALMRAYSSTDEPGYLEKAMAAFRAAVTCEAASASQRFNAAKSWVQYADSGHVESALEAYRAAIELLPRLAMLGLDLQSRHQALTAGSDGLARDAAAYAIRLGRCGEAVELLEEGRAVFWSQALQLHTPMTNLHKVAPQLEAELRRISLALEEGSLRDMSTNLSDAPQKVMSMEQEASHFSRLNNEWMVTLEKVRQLDGFQDFLHTSRLSTLQRAAANGPVVILNASKSGCDGLIMTSSHVEHIPLPGLGFEFVKILVGLIQTATARNSLQSGDFLVKISPLLQQMSFVSDATRSLRQSVEDRHCKRVSDTPMDPEDIFRFVLGALWIFVVEPVIDSLNFEQSENPPNLKWCPTGPFAFLPVHAAGFYYGEMTERVSDYIVSSYVPTIGTLLRVLTPTSTLSATNPFRMMAVIQPQTLSYANQELENIAARVPNKCLVKLGIPGTPGTVNEVLSHLSVVSIAHFACHGEQNKQKPLESSLILEDGRLNVSRIMQQSIPNASLAFLCACETAMGHEDLPDEAMHLGATLLFAGFRGAVATMWSIADADGPKIADSFYEHLFKEYEMDNIGPDTTQAARALHHAVAKLRSENVSFARWVPFIHLGR